jgi:putative Mn2+ efflux pump MntP
MSNTFDIFLTIVSLFVGIMLLTGNGGIFMKGGNDQARKARYDEKKMEKACGIALVLVGVATGIDSFTTSLAAKIGYTVALILILGWLLYYIRRKCQK